MKVIEQKIRSLYHSTVFLLLVSEFLHIFSFFRVCLCRHFVCFSPVSRPRTQILSLFILAAILNKFPSPRTNRSRDFCCVPGSFLPPPPYWKGRRPWGRGWDVIKNFTIVVKDNIVYFVYVLFIYCLTVIHNLTLYRTLFGNPFALLPVTIFEEMSSNTTV